METTECDLQRDLGSVRVDIAALTYTFMIVMLVILVMLCRTAATLNNISRELEFSNHVFSTSVDAFGKRHPSTPPWELQGRNCDA
jgi:hypothetical protein